MGDAVYAVDSRLVIEQKPGADATEFQDKRKKVLTPDELEDALLKQVSFDPLNKSIAIALILRHDLSSRLET